MVLTPAGLYETLSADVGFFTNIAQGWPGQPSNPVGFAAAPGFPGSLTYWSGGLPAYAASLGGGLIINGTAGNPKIISFQEFDGLSNSAGGCATDGVEGHSPLLWVTFRGCKFTANSFGGSFNVFECYKEGAGHIRFEYCTFAPRSAYWTKPPTGPHGNWPDATVGTGFDRDNPSTWALQVPYVDGGSTNNMSTHVYAASGNIVYDHCDFWGSGESVNPSSGTDGLIMTDCWIHDYRTYVPTGAQPTHSVYVTDGGFWNSGTTYPINAIVSQVSGPPNFPFGGSSGVFRAIAVSTGVDPNADCPNSSTDGSFWHPVDTPDHQNGIVWQQGVDPKPVNVLINHCTVTGTGNSRGLFAEQGGTSALNNITITNNYCSGFNQFFSFVDDGATRASNMTVTGNVFATDISNSGPVYTFGGENMATIFGANGNRWRNNTVSIYFGDNWSVFMNWTNGQTYSIGDAVKASDGFYYSALNNTTSSTTNPAGNGSPAIWNQLSSTTKLYVNLSSATGVSILDFAG